MDDKRILVIGGGVAGISAALTLARAGVSVDIVERSHFLGGHAIGYACKATDQCVKCGACLVEEKLSQLLQSAKITVHTGSEIERISPTTPLEIEIKHKPHFIDAEKCTACRYCLENCPAPKAILKGSSKSQRPFFAVDETRCLYFKDRSCRICQEKCPEKAMNLDAQEKRGALTADGIVLATGFTPFDPVDKPYGYGLFPNVITGLDLDHIVKESGKALRPSDNTAPNRIAFIQCVGSRDSKTGHLWCSQVCCGAALRMANLIEARQPESEITVFYIDIQRFGKDFEPFYAAIKDKIQLIRAIPGDIFPVEDDRLKVIYWNQQAARADEEIFDMVVLSVGITPCDGTRQIAERLGIDLADTGFAPGLQNGIFTAGTAVGPMSILDSIASAEASASKALRYLDLQQDRHTKREGLEP